MATKSGRELPAVSLGHSVANFFATVLLVGGISLSHAAQAELVVLARVGVWKAFGGTTDDGVPVCGSRDIR